MCHAGKVEAIKDLCSKLGVHYGPKRLDGVWIIPIVSWYHAAFDTEPDVPKAPDITQASMADAAARALLLAGLLSLLMVHGFQSWH